MHLRLIVAMSMLGLAAGCSASKLSQARLIPSTSMSTTGQASVGNNCPLTAQEVATAFGTPVPEVNSDIDPGGGPLSEICAFGTFRNVPGAGFILDTSKPTLSVNRFPGADPSSPQSLSAERAAYENAGTVIDHPEWGADAFFGIENGLSGPTQGNVYFGDVYLPIGVPNAPVSAVETIADQLVADIERH